MPTIGVLKGRLARLSASELVRSTTGIVTVFPDGRIEPPVETVRRWRVALWLPAEEPADRVWSADEWEQIYACQRHWQGVLASSDNGLEIGNCG